MLELRKIVKVYQTGGETVNALKGIDLKFRRSEFVSILGQSGCGKTTMLNIIGGLDKYTSGDLIINGRSTKYYKDRDWDAYRNHSVGFVFQSYNLIPHQTVLQNVELALTLSGVSKAERRRRAKAALEAVGLSTQLKKRPAEMSGGQMQRVAIARAIVNDPDIILADEPTGALDTETSVQVMDILKEISKDRLVVMVTHNPELAEKYSTRIIRMLDGVITDDSMPLTREEIQSERERHEELKRNAKKEKKPSMSFATSFSLSLKNLFTKFGRTALTSFAGSIGIIGIALIFAVSNGMTNYIDTVQEETLSSYPLVIQSQNIDIGSLIMSFMQEASSHEKHENDAVYQKSTVADLVNALSNMKVNENDLKKFKTYIENEIKNSTDEDGIKEAFSGVQYGYNLDMLVYTENVDGTVIESDATALMTELLTKYMGSTMMDLSQQSAQSSPMSSMGMMGGMSAGVWQELLPGKDGEIVNDLVKKQYNLVHGKWPNSYNEIVLVLDKNNELDDMTLYALGLLPKEDIEAIMEAALNKEELKTEQHRWTYDEICAMEFRTVLPSDCYAIDETTGLYKDLRETEAGLRYVYSNGTPLKVTGIIKPNEDAVAEMLTGSIGYTSKLTEYIITQAENSDAVKKQKENATLDIFTGLPFKDAAKKLTDAEKAERFKEYLNGLTTAESADVYVEIMSIMPADQLKAGVEQSLGAMSREQMEAAISQSLSQQMGMSAEQIEKYVTEMSDADLKKLFSQAIEERIKAQYAQAVAAKLAGMSDVQLAGALKLAVGGYTDEQCALYYEEVLTFSESSYEDNLVALGCLDLSDPATISLYASSFENKDIIEAEIEKYNKNADEAGKISYTDYVGIMMSSITTIIDAITYVLIAFVAISLIVSSIMIGVITLISVQERTKEIGILRAIGASKRNVSSMFNAETVIIGFISGTLGVGITYLLCIPINIILHVLTGIGNLSTHLPIEVGIALVAISVMLTLFSGIIPSRSAAKKDPVVALRTE